MADKTWISCPDTAKLIRKTLRREFPGTKFSVRSSHGTSVNIEWTDGPTLDAVKSVTSAYAGGGFDGSIDLAYSCETWLLPDGSAAWGYSAGTEGSRGSDPGYAFAPPAPDAELVQFGAKYVFTERHYSEGMARRVRDELAASWSRVPGDFPEVRTDGGYGWHLDWDHPSNRGLSDGPGGCNPSRLFQQAIEERI